MRIVTRWPSAFDADVERALGACQGGLRETRAADVLAAYRNDARQTLLVAIDDGEVVGCVGVRAGEDGVLLQHMSVKADAARRGIARRLLTELVMRFAGRVEADANAEAAAFYRRLGFTITPVRVQNVVRYRCTLPSTTRASRARLAG